MFAMSVRVSPCSALCSAPSDGRSTCTALPSTFTLSEGWTFNVRSPLGPFTRTACSFTVTSTPLGNSTGFLPIRDIVVFLPDQSHELAAHPFLPGAPVGKEAARGGQDRHPE